MAYVIGDDCIACGTCIDECPAGDEKGNPVQGAAVQFCSDSQCMMAKTDENGMAVFEVEPGSYSVHILKVPSDYEKHLTEYRLSDTYSDVVVVLNFK